MSKTAKCPVCGKEWTLSDEDEYSALLKCPDCKSTDFSGDFSTKKGGERKHDDGKQQHSLKPQFEPAPKEDIWKALDAADAEDSNAAKKPSTGGGPAREVGGKAAANAKYIEKLTKEVETQQTPEEPKTIIIPAKVVYVQQTPPGGQTEGGEHNVGKIYSYIKKDPPASNGQVVVLGADKESRPTGSVTKEIMKECFIATATYGTGKDLAVFYRLRDEVLIKNAPGRMFTAIYYRIGPYPAAAIRRSKILKAASRLLLDAAAAVLRRVL
jgi:hypothetical protein